MRKKTFLSLVLFTLFLVIVPTFAAAQLEEVEDLEIFGLEVEKLLNFGSGLLATVLCALTFVAYQRTNKNRLKFVALAFLLFAVKAFLVSSELFIDELPWIDIVSSFLDFGILLSFFFGIIKK